MTQDKFDQDIHTLIHRLVTFNKSDALSPQDQHLLSTLLNRYTELKDKPTTPFPDISHLTKQIEEFQSPLSSLQTRAHTNSVNKGFWLHPQPPNLAEKLALIHSEVSEALEDLRNNHMQESTTPEGKPIGFPSELADIVIRTLDLAEYLGVDLFRSLLKKMAFNESRPFKHNKAFLPSPFLTPNGQTLALEP